MPFSKQIVCEAREGERGLSADRTQTGFWCSFSSLSCSCQLWTAWIGGFPQALLCLQSNLGHKICLWVNMQMKRYHHPTFFSLNYKAFVRRPFCSSELLPPGFTWLSSLLLCHLLGFMTIRVTHHTTTAVTKSHPARICCPHSTSWCLPDKSKNCAGLKPQHLQCS